MNSPGALNSHHGCTWLPLTSGRASSGDGKGWPSTRQRQARSTRWRQARVPDSQTRDSRVLMLVRKLDWSESQTSWMSRSSWNLICNAQYAHLATLRACGKVTKCIKFWEVTTYMFFLGQVSYVFRRFHAGTQDLRAWSRALKHWNSQMDKKMFAQGRLTISVTCVVWVSMRTSLWTRVSVSVWTQRSGWSGTHRHTQDTRRDRSATQQQDPTIGKSFLVVASHWNAWLVIAINK